MQLSTNDYDRLCWTGFANGDFWDSEKEVRDYFTVENLDNLFPNDHDYNQGELDLFADYVIEKRLHCRDTFYNMTTGVSSRRFQFNTIDNLAKFFNEIEDLKEDCQETWKIDFDKVSLKVTIKNSCDFSMADLDTFDHIYGEC